MKALSNPLMIAIALCLSSVVFAAAAQPAADLKEDQKVRVTSVKVLQLEGVSLDEDIWTTTPEVTEGLLAVRFGIWIQDATVTQCTIRSASGNAVVEESLELKGGEEVQFAFEGLAQGEYTFTASNASGSASLFFSVEGEIEAVQDRMASGEVHVYPNPVRDRQLNIRVASWINPSELTALRVTDLNGHPLMDQTMRLEPMSLTRMDVSGLDNGEYILIVVNDRERRSVRFSVQH